MKRFVMLSNSTLNKRAVTGTTVYEFCGHDYGCAREDTTNFGYEHISVTLDPNGGGPPFTHALHQLLELK